ncbi:hypothetical protein RK56_000245 [Escherichia coli]|nr:hypothetical protein RK56_000245 [Escherichia coli]
MRAVTGKWWLSGGDENKKSRRVSGAAERTMKINFMELFFRHQKSNAASLLRLQAIAGNVKNFRNFILS